MTREVREVYFDAAVHLARRSRDLLDDAITEGEVSQAHGADRTLALVTAHATLAQAYVAIANA